MSRKSALITGITGQDGSYLAELLLQKGYQVHGLCRRSSTPSDERIKGMDINLHYGDMTDGCTLFALLSKIRPDEVYNLAAQSDVSVSFENPVYTGDVNALGPCRLLEVIRILGLKSRFYQASTSELYGLVQQSPQNESTPFYPRSPYAVSKLYAYWMTVNYREAYKMFACNGILFNHESPKRGENFVTRKVTRALGRIYVGVQKCLYLGNLDAMRDWGHTRDFVEIQWLILQQESADDYVIATGEQHSVREFVTLAAEEMGITLRFEGSGLSERGVIAKIARPDETSLKEGMTIVAVDPKFFRPSEVDSLLGDFSKARAKLKFTPKVSFKNLVSEMMQEDLRLAKRELLLDERQLSF